MKKILVAEDNDSNFVLMTYMLRGKYDFERARSGQEAVAKATSGDFSLVLMDMKMPLMDGLEATRKIKAVRPQLPVIALTANVFDADRRNAAAAGCDNFLAKPIKRDQCLAMIAQYV